ncbi:hypothetical protein [Bermanella sp. R86510]|uniref:hypothetical protein n=1 Tax=unclassified Bermanella TaxID=2627862 RepID=UPI0037C87A69
MLNDMHKVERWVYPVLFVFMLVGVAIAFVDPEYYTTGWAREDGPVEWVTVFALLGAVVLCIHRVITLRKQKNMIFVLVWSMLAALAFFGAGEEISWGQRILGIESPEWFEQNNAQKETNLHNLVVGDTKINKLIFSTGLALALLVYLIGFSIAYRKSEGFKRFAEYFAVPIAKLHHVVAWISVAIIAEVIIKDVGRSSELFEAGAAVVFLLNITFPYNRDSFTKNHSPS